MNGFGVSIIEKQSLLTVEGDVYFRKHIINIKLLTVTKVTRKVNMSIFS